MAGTKRDPREDMNDIRWDIRRLDQRMDTMIDRINDVGDRVTGINEKLENSVLDIKDCIRNATTDIKAKGRK